jgi:copper(I)-binding protein
MKPSPKLAVLCLALPVLSALAAFSACAATGSADRTTINRGWTTVTAKSAPAAQGFFTIHNAGAADMLKSVTCPVASKTVIRNAAGESVHDLPVQAQQTIRLRAGGLHLVLEHPHFRFYPQADIPCSILFRDAGTIMLYLHVEPAGTRSYRASGKSRSGPA